MPRLQSRVLALALLFTFVASVGGQEKSGKGKTGTAKPPGTAGNSPLKEKPGESLADASSDDAKDAKGDGPRKDQTVYSYGLPTADGKNLPLSEYKGKVLLIVNLARQSNYASQLPALQKLYDTFKDKGFVVIGVPSNDFGNAEPGTPAEVAKFYADSMLTFPVMQVSTLTGVHELPAFNYLTKSKTVENDGLHWNFTKFLVDRKGKVIVCFPPEIAPDSLDMLAVVQEAVDGTWKPKKPKRAAPAEEDDDE